MIQCKECKKIPSTMIGAPREYCSHTHYAINSLDSIEDIKHIFPEGKCNDINWIVYSTSGVHGTYTALDDIEASWDLDENDENYVGRGLTVLIILPRMVRLIYGEIEVTSKDDIEYLRKLCTSSVQEIKSSQEGNMIGELLSKESEHHD